MLTPNIEKQLNQQVQLEANSSQLYLSMASWSENQGLSGASAFLYLHADEERMHMLKLIKFINERGGKARVPAISEPQQSFDSIQTVFRSILDHEIKVTGEINMLVDACLSEKDYTTHNFLQWYVSEQIEEEALARKIMDKLNLIGTDKGTLYLFDRELETLASMPSSGGKGE